MNFSPFGSPGVNGTVKVLGLYSKDGWVESEDGGRDEDSVSSEDFDCSKVECCSLRMYWSVVKRKEKRQNGWHTVRWCIFPRVSDTI